jgi:hypothetical protein
VPGRPGMTAEQAALAEARAELERLRATVTEQAVALHLHASSCHANTHGNLVAISKLLDLTGSGEGGEVSYP